MGSNLALVVIVNSQTSPDHLPNLVRVHDILKLSIYIEGFMSRGSKMALVFIMTIQRSDYDLSDLLGYRNLSCRLIDKQS